jgi:hypothetical protein
MQVPAILQGESRTRNAKKDIDRTAKAFFFDPVQHQIHRNADRAAVDDAGE